MAMMGETVCGDKCLVKSFGNECLLAVIDGIGHGEQAAIAAEIAAATLEKHAADPLLSLIDQCHQALIRSNGVVMTLALINGLMNSITWLGVGNVEGLILRMDASSKPNHENVMMRGGVVGGQLPSLRTETLSMTKGDLIIFATDGIHSSFSEGLELSIPPQEMADQILRQHGNLLDDSLVLVACYLGFQNE